MGAGENDGKHLRFGFGAGCRFDGRHSKVPVLGTGRCVSVVRSTICGAISSLKTDTTGSRRCLGLLCGAGRVKFSPS